MTVHTFHASRIEAAHNTSGDLALTPTADGVLAVQGNQAIVSRKLGIVAAWAAATPLFPQTNASIADVRIESPAFADINPASVRPLAELGSGIAADALGVTDLACEPGPVL